MTAVVRTLYIEQGATYPCGFNCYHEVLPPTVPPTPDLANPWLFPAGTSARMQIREFVGAPVLVEASTLNGRIVLGATDGRIDITLTDADTDLLTVEAAVYDLEVVYPVPITLPPTEPVVVRVLQGPVVVSPNVTTDQP